MLKTLLRIIQEVSAAPSLDQALAIVVARTRSAIQTDAVSIFFADYNHHEYILMATEGLNPEYVGRAKLKFGDGLVGLVGEREQPINLDDAPVHPNFRYMPEIGEEKYHAFLGVPIIHQRRLLGVLVAQQREPRRFDEDEEAFLITLSAQLAGAIAHAQATGMSTELKEGTRKDTVLNGLAGSAGIAVGKGVVVYPVANLEAVPDREPDDIDAEIIIFQLALKAVQDEITQLNKNFISNLPMEERALFDVYLKILRSKSFIGEVKKEIRAGNWAQGALKNVVARHVSQFETMDDFYLQERAADLRDLGQRILFQMQATERVTPEFPAKTILIGEEVMPAALAEVPEGRLAGIVSVRGSINSHVAVLARALNIPAVMGVLELPVTQLEGEDIVVDGYQGQIYLSPSRSLRREFVNLMKEEKELDEELKSLRDQPAQTLDGHKFALYVNLGLIADIERTKNSGTEGVGLYRTEVPFMMQERFPSEEEQRAIYRQLLQVFAPRPVMMRTLDIGGDKSLPYFPVVEDNPFLGWRGLRISLDHPEIFLVQLRAMMRASIGLNNLNIMLPMVSSVTELDDAALIIRQAYEDLVAEGLALQPPAIGVMVEIPSAVYQACELARRVDFLSVGSNDLTQYILAVDRNNARVANLYDSLHPAVIRALLEVVDAAHSEGKHASICGEMAGDPAAVVLLIAMGFDSLSMSATRLLRVKWVIRNFSLEFCKKVLQQVLQMDNPRDIRNFMQNVLTEAGLGGLIRAGGK